MYSISYVMIAIGVFCLCYVVTSMSIMHSYVDNRKCNYVTYVKYLVVPMT